MHDSDEQLTARLCDGSWRLCFNATALAPEGVDGEMGVKTMTFVPGGALEPANHHEASWRVRDGRLEFLEPDGRVHSRFFWHEPTATWYNDNDPALPCRKGQFMRRGSR